MPIAHYFSKIFDQVFIHFSSWRIGIECAESSNVQILVHKNRKYFVWRVGQFLLSVLFFSERESALDHYGGEL